MKKNILFLLFLLAAFKGAGQGIQEALEPNFLGDSIIVPSIVKYDTLCTQDDIAVDPVTKKSNTLRKSFAGLTYVPVSYDDAGDKMGYILLTHEENNKNDSLGDGGGVTQFKVQKDNSGKWSVVKQTIGKNKNVKYKNVNFDNVGGIVNARGIISWRDSRQDMENKPHVLVCEDINQTSNADISASFSSLADFKIPAELTLPADPNSIIPENTTLKKYQELNWITEIDPVAAVAVRKQYTMGKFGHTNVLKTVAGFIMTSNTMPSVLFKYEAQELDDPSQGELKFYKQEKDGHGEWISLSDSVKITDSNGNMKDTIMQVFDSLLVIQEKALKKGATMFANLAGIAYDDNMGILYLAERGTDNSGDNFNNPSKIFNGTLANHLSKRDSADGSKDGVITDYYGRILELNVATDALDVALEGGNTKDGKYNFSNPTELSIVKSATLNEQGGNLTYLVIKEDINGITQRRNPSQITDVKNKINETYALQISQETDYNDPLQFPFKPSIDSLKLFLIGPKGTQITGGCSSPDLSTASGDTYFACIRSSDGGSGSIHKNMVVAFRNIILPEILTALDKPEFSSDKNTFEVWPNPVERILYLNKTTDIGLYNIEGILMKQIKNTSEINITNLPKGAYFIQNSDKQVKKVIIQ